MITVTARTRTAAIRRLYVACMVAEGYRPTTVRRWAKGAEGLNRASDWAQYLSAQDRLIDEETTFTVA